jgi:hypothetical protein
MIGGFLVGGLKEAIVGTYGVIRHPIQTLEGAISAITHPIATTAAIGGALNEGAKKFFDLEGTSDFTRGAMLGGLAVTVAPIPGAGKGKGLAKAADAAHDLNVYKEIGGLNTLRTAAEIGSGHAWYHILNDGDFGGVNGLFPSQSDFIQHIFNVMENPTASKRIQGDKMIFRDDPSHTIIFYDPQSADKGTAFERLNDIQDYYDNKK